MKTVQKTYKADGTLESTKETTTEIDRRMLERAGQEGIPPAQAATGPGGAEINRGLFLLRRTTPALSGFSANHNERMTMQLMNAPDTTRLADDLDRGLSLPSSWYTDPAILALEHERIFRRTWQYVARDEQLQNLGDYVTGVAGDVPVVVVRGPEGLKAFVNVCRHRRHLVMSESGNRKVLQCPYHAWTYDLDGCLKAAPRAEREDGFRKEDYPLLPVRVERWGPFVFVNVDPDAEPLASYLGDMPQMIADSGLDISQLKLRQRREWRSGANWKVMLENFLECYHCPVAHPGFSAVIDVDPDAYALEPRGWVLTQVAPVRAAAVEGKVKKAGYDVRGEITKSQYYLLWPNLTISINPGQPNFEIDVWLPDGALGTQGFSEHYFGPDVSEEYAEQVIAFNKEVGDEDDALTDSVQLGLRAGLPAQGRFLAKSEQLVIAFQKLVVAALS
jgi:phenylpropionate dioxygenase-like ring-hydroxylating dioxygenase large terminal subunit